MINILFGGNEKVYDGILLCLLSMAKHTDSILNIYILTANLTELNENFKPLTEKHALTLEKILKQKNPQSKVKLIELGESFKNWINQSKNKLNNFTPFAFLRLFANEIDDLPNKIIYLDTDIMINGNIKELFDIDISNFELGVVLDKNGHIFIKPKYFNSGMLLMHMSEIKKSNLFERAKLFCQKKKMAFPDQTSLNKCCKKKLYIPTKFNEQGKLKKNTIVHHFSKKIKWFPFFHTQNIKPWQVDKVRNIYKCNNYDDIYEKFFEIKQQEQNEKQNKHLERR